MVRAQLQCNNLELGPRDASENGTLADDPDAAEYHFGTADNSAVSCHYLNGCSLQYDRAYDAAFYDPGQQGEAISALVSKDGILNARFTGAGVHYHSYTDADLASGRFESQLRRYTEPAGERRPNQLDDNVVLVHAHQKNLSVPVLVYQGGICIDYRPQQEIKGLGLTTPGEGEVNPAYTRNLYSNFTTNNIVRDGIVRRISYAPYDEPAANSDLKSAVEDLYGYLKGSAPTYGAALNLLEWYKDRIGSGNQLPHERMTRFSVLGGPIPIKLTADSRAVVAPLLQRSGISAAVTVAHPGTVSAGMLADRLGRQRNRNVIGVSMQKIGRCHQGDIMLHDGV